MSRIMLAFNSKLARSITASGAPLTPLSVRPASTQTSSAEEPASERENLDSLKSGSEETVKAKKKTQLELDEELRQKLEGISGDGGDAGRELEGGKPVAMKRGVKENMFRYI